MAKRYGMQLLHAIFLLVFLVLHASSCEQEDYWKMKLPNVPMPQAIKDSLLHVHENTINQKFEAEASIDQPYTVFSWKYDNTDKAEAQKLAGKTRIDQPFTVSAWKYDSNNAEDKKFHNAASVDQPFTVLAWKYDDSNKAKGQKLEKNGIVDQPYTVSAWKYGDDPSKVEGQNLGKKEKIDQPFTVFAWKYDDSNKAKGQKFENKASVDQPFTVFAWKYDDSKKVNDQTLEKNSIVDQPYIVFAWKYDDPNKVEGQKARIHQPFTVSAWKYDSNNVKDQKLEKKANVDQPFTVSAWKYNKENAKEEGSKEQHHHNHAMHNVINLDDAQQDLKGGSVFFVEKSLRLGMKLKHDFQKTPKVPFLPQHIAQSIPFSDAKFAEILNLFSIKADSPKATAVKGTLDVCLHRPKVKKENRTCAQSMEDVVNFVVGELGTNDVELRMMRNDIEVIPGITDYVITKVKKLVVPRNTAVACHRMSYPYVVYYCHHQEDIGHYDVTLVSPTMGAAIQTTAVCHYDTYAWQPDVPALRYLGIRPGDAPVCHFSAINDMFWAIQDNSKSSLDKAQ